MGESRKNRDHDRSTSEHIPEEKGGMLKKDLRGADQEIEGGGRKGERGKIPRLAQESRRNIISPVLWKGVAGGEKSHRSLKYCEGETNL